MKHVLEANRAFLVLLGLLPETLGLGSALKIFRPRVLHSVRDRDFFSV